MFFTLRLNYKQAIKGFRNLYITTVVVVLFLSHPTLTEQTFKLFACRQLGTGSDDWYLVQDVTIRCYTNEHYQWVLGLGLPMLFFYVVGIPAFGLMLMRFHARKGTKNLYRPSVLRKYSFLYKGYRLKA